MEKTRYRNLVNNFQNKPKIKGADNQDLIKQLYEQIGQLGVERDWLKKICIVWTWRGFVSLPCLSLKQQGV